MLNYWCKIPDAGHEPYSTWFIVVCLSLSFVIFPLSPGWFMLDIFQGLKPLMLCSTLVWSASVCCRDVIMWPWHLTPEGRIMVSKCCSFKLVLTTSSTSFDTCSVGSCWRWRHRCLNQAPMSALCFFLKVLAGLGSAGMKRLCSERKKRRTWVLIDISPVDNLTLC